MTELVGYRQLSKRDYRASRIGAFGTVKRQKVLLARRPLKRSFFIGAADSWFLDLEIVAPGQEAIRDAVVIEWHFTNSFGKLIEGQDANPVDYLFADPQGFSSCQRVWVKRPLDAVFATASISRNVKGVKLGLYAKLKLQKAKRQHEGRREQLPRDYATLRTLLRDMLENAQFEGVGDVLERMIYLRRLPEDRRSLEIFMDARKLLEVDFKLNLPSYGYSTGAEQHDYDALLTGTPAADNMLSRWLSCEALLLASKMKEQKNAKLFIQGQADVGYRLLAAQAARDLCEHAFEIEVQQEIKVEDITSVSPFISQPELLRNLKL